MSRMPLRAAWLLPVVALALFAACGGSDDDERETSGPPRDFMLGFSSLPRELNTESYEEAIDFAADHGEMLLIQRPVPWRDFLPGSTVGDDVAQTTRSERAVVGDNDLRLFYAIDPTDGATARDRLVDLPPELADRRFDDPDIRAAFVSYAEYVALNYEPDVLALGVEMNLYYERNPEDFENFRSLYDEAYAAVKRASPDTLVTVTLQYEDLQGILPRDDRHFANWQLVRAFEPNIDLVAISTYPSFAFAGASAIPENYYSQLRAFTDRPIAIAEMGFSSDPAQGVNSGSEADQAAFVERVLREADELSMPFAVWFAIWDPGYARDTEFGAFQSIGLLRSDDSEKPAWAVWSEMSRRPYREASEEE